MINMIKKIKNVLISDIKLILLCLLLGALSALIFCSIKAYCDNIQGSIASKIVRLHVIANSDSKNDQALKLYVRNKVISSVPKAQSREESLKLISENIGSIQTAAQNAVYEKGYDYKVTAQVKKALFPTRHYGDVSLLPGEYDTLEIKIGSGKGHNWWCVVYPPMCFSELDGENPDDYQKQLSDVLSEDEYELVADDNAKVKIKFKLIELIEENF